jgi:hypothetical protein
MKEDIIRMARAAGYLLYDLTETNGEKTVEIDDEDEWAALERFISLVLADERGAVCRIVTGLCISDNNAEEINRAIRARGEDPMPLFDDWGKDWR